MFQKIYSYITILAACLLILISCDKNDDKIELFSTNIDVSKSSLKDYVGVASLATTTQPAKNVHMLFSIDEGKTFAQYPKISVGQSYMVKVVKQVGSKVTELPCLEVDWSGSQPQPKQSGIANIGEFVAQTSNSISAKVVGEFGYPKFDPSIWGGPWTGDESGCCNSKDKNFLTQDPTDPTKYVMDNFWGDGVEAYIIFSPSTSLDDQFVTLPEQVTSEGGTASGSGTYDPCTGTFSINTKYVIGGDTYEFLYSFHR